MMDSINPYLYMIEEEFREVSEFIKTLRNYNPPIADVDESTTILNALHIAVVISYMRNFTNNRGFENIKNIKDKLIQNFGNKERKLHKKIKDLRDMEYAHSDSSAYDFQIETEGLFSHSVRPMREPLDDDELKMLSLMVRKIRTQINSLKNCSE
ncbi:MAG: hypothetical protein IIA48_09390 [Bacteroidetes bacterium]|nr:hypothetical protein [Bacteroidota bacterium]